MQTVLVTGAAGFIGSHLVDALLRDGYNVRAADRNTDAPNLAEAMKSPRMSYHVADVAEAEACHELCDGADAVLHFAAMASVPESLRRPDQCRRDTLGTTQRLLRAAGRYGVRSFVLASTAAVYGNRRRPVRETVPLSPLNPYAQAKADAEAAVLNAGMPRVCLRFFNVYGPRQRPDSPYAGVITRFVDAVSRGEPIRLHGDGRQTRDFLHVQDAVRAVFLALRFPYPAAFNVGTGRGVTLLELIAAIERHAGRRAVVVHEPPREGDILYSVADLRRARRELGFQPEVSLDDGLATLHGNSAP
jgi:UDP-glucose 4-epimerase